MKRILLTLIALGTMFAVGAQTDYHIQKVTLFELLPVGHRDIVFLGNSLTDGCEWAELFGNPHIKNRGINADNTVQMLERLDPIVSGQPKKLFLLTGVNDLADGRSPEATAENIARIVDRFRKESPRTKIFVQSVLPVNDTYGRFKSYNDGALDEPIRQLNVLIEKLCAERGIVFIDLYSHFVGEDGRMKAELTNDGLHLKGPGYLIWKGVIEKYVK